MLIFKIIWKIKLKIEVPLHFLHDENLNNTGMF